jgi:hypothetical protein
MPESATRAARPATPLHVRAASPSFALLEHVRSRVEALDPNLSILEARTRSK